MNKLFFNRLVKNLTVVFLTVYVLGAIFNAFGNAMLEEETFRFYWLSFSPNFWEWITKPWTIFSYVFFHNEIWHFVVNVALFIFLANTYLRLLTKSHFWTVFILSTILGALFFGLVSWIYRDVIGIHYDTDSELIGLSPVIYALGTMLIVKFPYIRISLYQKYQIPIRYCILIPLCLDLIFITDINYGAHSSHIGGAMMGYVLGRYPVTLPQLFSRAKYYLQKIAKVKASVKI